MSHEFSPEHKEGVYQAIYQRRDMRHFTSAPVDSGVLQQLLSAAHAAPSVGMMQPWRIIRVTDVLLRKNIHALTVFPASGAAMSVAASAGKSPPEKVRSSGIPSIKKADF